MDRIKLIPTTAEKRLLILSATLVLTLCAVNWISRKNAAVAVIYSSANLPAATRHTLYSGFQEGRVGLFFCAESFQADPPDTGSNMLQIRLNNERIAGKHWLKGDYCEGMQCLPPGGFSCTPVTGPRAGFGLLSKPGEMVWNYKIHRLVMPIWLPTSLIGLVGVVLPLRRSLHRDCHGFPAMPVKA